MAKLDAHFVFLALVFSNTHAKEEESNEVTPPRLPINLDANLRRALLKALTELENEENEKAKLKQPDTPEEFNLPHIDTRDKIVEKASASALSFFASTGSPTSTTTEELTVTDTTTTEESEPFVLIQKSNGIQHKPITSFEKHIDPAIDPEQILTSASSSFTADKFKYKTEETRSIGSGNSNSLETKVKPETTTVTTTTSTEENEAKVEDVQFFSAPLVAAFTVHQDEQGIPKKVEPIYKANAQNIQGISQSLQKVEQKIRPTQSPDHVKSQLALQEKQKVLEEEIARLRQQQAQQNLLIRQQQALHEQQLSYKQNLYQEQLRVQNNQRPFQPLLNTTPQPSFNTFQNTQPTSQPSFNTFHNTQPTPQPSFNTFHNTQPTVQPIFNNFQQLPFTANNNFNKQTNFNSSPNSNFNNNSRIKGSLVSFQPSITFNHHTETLPLNAQQLPVKSAVDFRGQFQQFPNNFNSFNFASPSSLLTAPKHNRVFRQEATTGNFLNSGNSNSGLLDSYNPSQRFFRSSTADSGFNNLNRINNQQISTQQIQPPTANHHLNNLLYNSGIYRGAKQQEDLNIVSKVLSLNHYGKTGQDFRFGSFSSINEQRVPAPETSV